jgi:hypothetical protein
MRPTSSPPVSRAARDLASLLTAMAIALSAPPIVAQPVSVVVPPNAILPNYDRIPMGQDEGIEAGAFVARTGDAAANWYNPAGLGKSVGSAVDASATAYEWTTMTIEGLGTSAGRSRIGTVGTLFSGVIGEGTIDSDRWRLGFAVARPIAWRPSSIDVAFPLNGGQEVFAYSTDVDFSVMIPGVAVAFAPGGVRAGTFRIGTGIGVAITSLSQTQGISARSTTATDATAALRSFSGDGSVWSLNVSGGVQWDVTPGLTLGVRAVAPGVRLRGSTLLTFQSSLFTSSEFRDLIFQDLEAEFDYKLPLEVDVGAALRFANGEIEVDARYYAEIDEYEMYKSSEPGRLTIDAGGTPALSTLPFATTMNSARSVVNVSVGGNYRLSRLLRVHAGFATDQSPVPDDSSSIFRKVDLTRFNAGVSLTGSGLSGSFGLGYSSGSGTRQIVGAGEAPQPIETRLDTRTINLLIAISYAFPTQ